MGAWPENPNFQLWSLPQRKSNATENKIIAVVPFVGKTSASDSIWPNGGQMSPMLPYQGVKSIKSYSIRVRTTDDRPMVFLSGMLRGCLAFYY